MRHHTLACGLGMRGRVTTRTYVKGVVPWLLLGPLTGPLAEGIVRNWRAGETTLAACYGLALWLTTYDLYAFGGRLITVAIGLRASL